MQSNKFTKYKELTGEGVKLEVTLGKQMHRVDITYKDYNKTRWTLHRIAGDIIVVRPKLWERTKEKLAILHYLSSLVFNNSSFIINEDRELNKTSKEIKKYKKDGAQWTSDSVYYVIPTEMLTEKEFSDYDIRLVSKVAKNFKFPVARAR